MPDANTTEDRGSPRVSGEQQREFARILHERARSAGTEYHRLMTSLSTGLLAAYFIALTGHVAPRLGELEHVAAILCVVFAAVAVAAAVIGWFADAMRNYYWALSVASSGRKARQSLYKRRDLWLRLLRLGTWTLTAAFMCSVAASVVYLVDRMG